MRLPPLVRDVTIEFTALSLVDSQSVQFRYRLEGHDNEWQEAGDRRQAFYTNLKPGDYRFLVKASNNNGVWKPQQGLAQIDRSASVQVSLSLKDKGITEAREWTEDKPLDISREGGQASVQLNLAPGGVRIIELISRGQ